MDHIEAWEDGYANTGEFAFSASFEVPFQFMIPCSRRARVVAKKKKYQSNKSLVFTLAAYQPHLGSNRDIGLAQTLIWNDYDFPPGIWCDFVLVQ